MCRRSRWTWWAGAPPPRPPSPSSRATPRAHDAHPPRGPARAEPRVELTHLTVRNFRNLAALEVDFPARGSVVVGDNGQGKTNLLEAVYYLVLFRSLRGVKDRELVRFGEAGFFVAGAGGCRVTAG